MGDSSERGLGECGRCGEYMSAPVAGKFQDHYLVLGVDGKADLEKIQAAYAKLTERYSSEAPDADKLEAVSLAFEVLSDVNLRASFDRLKGGGEDGKPAFSGAAFFESLKRGAGLRAAVLCVLCDRRCKNPFQPSLSIRHLENMLQVTTEEMTFALWYLKQRMLVVNDDKSSLQITVDGMDQLERNPPAAEQVLPFLKPDAVREKTEAPGTGPVLNALNRALTVKAGEAAPAGKR